MGFGNTAKRRDISMNLHEQVVIKLGSFADAFDIASIVEDIEQGYGGDIEGVDPDDFRAMLIRHERQHDTPVSPTGSADFRTQS